MNGRQGRRELGGARPGAKVAAGRLGDCRLQRAPAGRRGMARRPRLLGVLIAALALCICALPASAWALSPESFTWTGGTLAASGLSAADWSGTTNWTPEASLSKAPAENETVGKLTFPSLSSSAACKTEPPSDTCYMSTNNVKGLTVNGIEVYGGAPYYITGEAITLGAGGIKSTPAIASSIGPSPTLDLPIKLGAAQSWLIEGGEEGGQLDLAGAVTGAAETLGVELKEGGRLSLENGVEVGNTTIKGANPSLTGAGAGVNGFVDLLHPPVPGASTGTLNSTDLHSVTVEHAAIDGVGSLGSLTLTGGQIQVGNGYPEPGLITVDGALSLDSASVALFTIGEAGTTAGTDYGQLKATGNVNLGGAEMVVLLRPNGPSSCPALKAGDVDTILSTTGSLTGTFAGVPNGTVIETAEEGPECKKAKLVIEYGEHAVTATVLTPAPLNTAAPVLSGTVAVGQTLSCSEGSWANSPSTLTYSWLRGETVITGQTGSTYVVQAADQGQTITCEVTASNAGGQAAAKSSGLAIPPPPPAKIETTKAPAPPPAPTPIPPPRPTPGTAVATGLAKVEGDHALVSLHCTGAGACEGSLKLLYKERLKKVVRRRGKKHVAHITKMVTVGEASFSIAAGGHLTLHVTLTGEGAKLAKKAGRHGLKVSLSGSDVHDSNVRLTESGKPGKGGKGGKGKGHHRGHGARRGGHSHG